MIFFSVCWLVQNIYRSLSVQKTLLDSMQRETGVTRMHFVMLHSVSLKNTPPEGPPVLSLVTQPR